MPGRGRLRRVSQRKRAKRVVYFRGVRTNDRRVPLVSFLSSHQLGLKLEHWLIKKEKPDLVHLNSTKISILGSLACIPFKVKVLYTAHGWIMGEDELLPRWKLNFYGYLEVWSAKLKTHIICLSEPEKKMAIEWGIPKEKITIIYNGI